MRLYPGFDILRILAASTVVFSHSFLIAELVETNEPIKAATGTIFGVYGVMVFFILSGFLVTDSALRSRTLGLFAAKRALRLLPGFLAVNLLVVTVICPFYATGGSWAFLGDARTWSELVRVLTFQDSSLTYPSSISFFPTGDDGSSLSSVANGVLWTIRIEITCYAIVGLLKLTRVLTGGVVLLVVCLSVLCALSPSLYIGKYVSNLLYLAPCFSAGMLMRMFLHGHQADRRVALASAAMLLILMLNMGDWSHYAGIFFPLFCAYPLLWIGQQNTAPLRQVGRFGDPSYGMYLWGWPIQMVLRSLVGPEWSGWAFAALALPIVIVAGYLSWFAVESPFMRLRPRTPAGGRVPDGVGSAVPAAAIVNAE